MQKVTQSGASFGQEALSHLDSLYGYAMSLCRQPAEAEDLVQETFVRAVKKFDELPPDSHLKAWLCAILRNAWLNQVRHSRSGPLILDLDAGDQCEELSRHSPGNDPYDCYVAQAQHRDLRAAIEGLPVLLREVILLREFECMSYQDISQIVGIPLGTVMSRLGRAREKLRQALMQWDNHAAGPAAKTRKASR